MKLTRTALLTLSLATVLSAATPSLSAAPNPPALRIEGTVVDGSYLYTRRSLDGTVDGQSMVACIRFDPTNAPSQSGDGVTYRQESSSSKPYVSVTMAFSGGLAVANSRSATATPQMTALYRNYPNGALNQVLINVSDTQTSPDGAYRGLFKFNWQAWNSAGTASTLFQDPNGGLSYFQPLNLAGASQFGEFNVVQLDPKSGTTLRLVGQFITTGITAVKGC